MEDIATEELFVYNGTVDELQLDQELQQHLVQQLYYEKHQVGYSEILEVHGRQPKYFKIERAKERL